MYAGLLHSLHALRAPPTPTCSVPEYLGRVRGEIEAEHEYIQSLLDQKQMEEEAASGVRMREVSSHS